MQKSIAGRAILVIIDVMRAMRKHPDQLPIIGESGRYLGARPALPTVPHDGDIPVRDDGTIEPETGGMSVSPQPVTNLPLHRRPREYGGQGKGPVFVLDTDELPTQLQYRQDPKASHRHGFIEPSRRMSFEEYQESIHATRALWSQFR